MLGLFKRLIHSGFTECLKLFSQTTPPPWLIPPSTLPHTPFIQSAFDCSKRLVVCNTNSNFAPSDVQRSAKNDSPCSPFHYVESRTVQMESLSLRVSMLLSPLCARASAERERERECVPRVHQVCDSGELCAEEKMVSGPYLVSLYLIYMVSGPYLICLYLIYMV